MNQQTPSNPLLPLRTLLQLLAIACLATRTCKAIPESLIVHVTGGLVQGKPQQGAVQFLGIPYATALRFQVPSMSVQGWSDILNSSQPGSQCPQHCPPVIRDLYCLHENQMSENCLTLNIYRPAYNLPSGKAFPVMVFIHGGGFRSGSGAAPLYNGAYLARAGDVIVVTINYRLGAFGFLPIFNSYDDVIGNLGILDQQMALHWVKHNIAKFDGDPNKVTLLGEEAGCQSVGLHLTSTTSNPLFHSAILHSCPFTLSFRGKNESRLMATEFASALGCPENDVTCFRQRSTKEILQAQETVSNQATSRSPSLRQFQVWGPIVDRSSVFDPSLLQELTKASQAMAKPVMIGFVAQEGRTSVYRNFPLPVSDNYFQRLIEAEIPDKWRQVAETPETPYHTGDVSDARGQMVRFINDFVYVCPAQRLAALLDRRASDQGQGHNVWTYTFDPKVTWSPGGSAWPPGGEAYCQNEACQGLDLLYLFNPPSIPQRRRARAEGLTTAMAFYWTNFAKYHNPNGDPQRAGAVLQGNLFTSRAPRTRGNAAFQSIPAGYPSMFSRTSGLTSSLLRLMQGVRSASARGTPSPALRRSQPRRGQFGSAQRRPSLLPAGSGLASLFSHIRGRFPSSSVRSSGSFAEWPRHVTLDPLTSARINVTLELTQPRPVARRSLFDDVCRFWEFIGYS